MNLQLVRDSPRQSDAEMYSLRPDTQMYPRSHLSLVPSIECLNEINNTLWFIRISSTRAMAFAVTQKSRRVCNSQVLTSDWTSHIGHFARQIDRRMTNVFALIIMLF